MRKMVIISVLTLVSMMFLIPSAFALQAPYTHGDFATNSKGCGDCHVTHSAGAAKLLNTTSSYQTVFCLSCHGKTSPFDVQYGQIVKDSADTPANPIATRWNWTASDATNLGTNTNFSLAGGFMNSLNFKVDGEGTVATQDTSVHNVRGLQTAGINIANVSTYSFVSGDLIPGGTGNTLDFECGSCHDPHAGGASAPNPRLLRQSINGRTGMTVTMTTDANNLPTSYNSGFNNWCGSCHDIFDTSALADTYYASPKALADSQAARTGYYLIGGRTKYMHLMGVTVDDTKKPASVTGNPYGVKYMALDSSKKLQCLSCHRAHGSSAPVSGLTWNRYSAYKDGGGTATAIGSGSALLRLPNRDVCYDCHDAAVNNHNQTH